MSPGSVDSTELGAPDDAVIARGFERFADVVDRLSDAQLTRYADLFADLVADRRRYSSAPAVGALAPSEQLVTAAELAARFGVKPGWAYRHADKLGVVHLGETGAGRKPRVRFDLEVAREAIACSASKGSQAKSGSSTEDSPAPRPRPRRSPKPAPVVGQILGSRPRIAS